MLCSSAASLSGDSYWPVAFKRSNDGPRRSHSVTSGFSLFIDCWKNRSILRGSEGITQLSLQIASGTCNEAGPMLSSRRCLKQEDKVRVAVVYRYEDLLKAPTVHSDLSEYSRTPFLH
jgi:hypothetical protein